VPGTRNASGLSIPRQNQKVNTVSATNPSAAGVRKLVDAKPDFFIEVTTIITITQRRV
jgi:hypothetical protein